MTVDVLKSVRRPTVPLAAARARNNPMVHTLADALTAEFGVTWTVAFEAELVPFGRRGDYTTQRLISTDRLDAFPEWSARYADVVQSVAQVTGFGTQGYDPKESLQRSEPAPSERQTYVLDDDVGVVLEPIDIPDSGPSRITRDSLGGNIVLEIDSDGTLIFIAAAVPADNHETH